MFWYLCRKNDRKYSFHKTKEELQFSVIENAFIKYENEIHYQEDEMGYENFPEEEKVKFMNHNGVNSSGSLVLGP